MFLRSQIGTMRYASVFEFKGKKYVNIREYYEKDGKTLPGKKGVYIYNKYHIIYRSLINIAQVTHIFSFLGIAINSAQWHLFKQCIDVLDEKMK